MFLSFPIIYFSKRLYVKTETNDESILINNSSLVHYFNKDNNLFENSKTKKKPNFCQILNRVICDKLLIFVMLGKIVLLSVNAILIFWLPDYLADVIEIIEPKDNLLIYIIMTICSSILGGVICHLVTYLMKGYECSYGLWILLIINIITTCAFVVVPYVKQWYLFVTCIMIYKIGISAIVPVINGIILTSMPVNCKAAAFTFLILGIQIFGISPSNPLYTSAYIYLKKEDKVFSMKNFTYFSVSSIIWLFIAAIIQCCFQKNNVNDDEKKQQLMNKSNNSKLNENLSNHITKGSIIDHENCHSTALLEADPNQSEEENIINLSDLKKNNSRIRRKNN